VSYLLDTNIVSEWMKPGPSPMVAAWLDAVDEDRTFLSVISIAEIRQGIELMDRGRRPAELEGWLRDVLPDRFAGRLLPVDQEVAERWAMITVASRRAGIVLGIIDAFLAATAEAHGLTIVTRNVRDFAALGLPLLNPWDG
jgi:toxin FitB